MSQARALLETGKIRHTRSLVAGGHVLVEVGQRVAPDDIVAETELIPGAPYFLDIRTLLKMRDWDREAGSLILKRAGDPVAVREVVARRRSGPLGEVIEAASPVAGTVEWVSTARGEMVIREDSRSAEPVVAVNVARRLDVWPATVRAYLQCREGDVVRAGSVLAAAPSSLGVEAVYSPVEGRVERIDPGTGVVYIVRPSRVSRLAAAYPGVVASVEPGLAATIETEGVRIWGAYGAGRLSWGPLVVVEPSSPAAAAGTAPASWRGAVVALRGSADEPFLKRAREAGAIAVVAAAAPVAALAALWGRSPDAAGDDAEPAVVLTQGFGEQEMDDVLWQVLSASAGATATVDPTTQVRAGSLRPEIVLGGANVPAAGPAWRVHTGEASAGHAVRVLRGAHAGRRGRVIETLDVHRFPSGVRAPAARVVLECAGMGASGDGGEPVLVALDNLERLEAVTP